MTLLSVINLEVRHGDLRAVKGLSFGVEESDVFVLLGANGAGKTSLLRCISGLHRPAAGDIVWEGSSLIGLRPHQVAACGVAHVPEGRRVFANLSVEENLKVSFLANRAQNGLKSALDEVYALFPRLVERRRQLAGTMSGGEQQMLAIGRALMNAPRLLILDEPSLGLSPLIVETVFERLEMISRSGVSLLLVEQNAASLDLATRGVVLERGRAVLSGDRKALQQSDFVRKAYLGM